MSTRGNPALALRLLHALEAAGSFSDEQWEELMRRRGELSDAELRAILNALGGRRRSVPRGQVREQPDRRPA